jgi:hypothetical protein
LCNTNTNFFCTQPIFNSSRTSDHHRSQIINDPNLEIPNLVNQKATTRFIQSEWKIAHTPWTSLNLLFVRMLFFCLQVSFHAQLQRYSREQTQIKTTSTMSPCHISRSTWSRCKKKTHKCLQIFINACFIMWTHLKFHIAKIWRHG